MIFVYSHTSVNGAVEKPTILQNFGRRMLQYIMEIEF